MRRGVPVLCAAAMLAGLPAHGDGLPRAARTLAAGQILSITDIAPETATDPGAIALVGRAARRTVYAGRALRPEDFGAPLLVARNQAVTVSWGSGALAIVAEARALEPGGEGDVVRVLNTASHTTLRGTILADGSVRVGPTP